MTETRWTKGPWTVSDGEHEAGVVTGRTVHFGVDRGPSFDIFDAGDSPHETVDDEWMANAHLIAAAPDLYEALERVLLDIDFMVEDGTITDVREDIIYTNARAALAKARGEG